MAKILRVITISASIVCFSLTLVERAEAQSSCLAKDVAKKLASMVGMPTDWPGLLFLLLKTKSTAEPQDDQITQTNPRFADKNAKELKTEDKNLEDAQKFLNSEATKNRLNAINVQNCNANMQKIRDDIKKELNQRDKENIPENFSPKQARAFRDQQVDQAKNQHYDRNPRAGGAPPPQTGPGNTGGSGNPGQGDGGCGPGVSCSFHPGW